MQSVRFSIVKNKEKKSVNKKNAIISICERETRSSLVSSLSFLFGYIFDGYFRFCLILLLFFLNKKEKIKGNFVGNDGRKGQEMSSQWSKEEPAKPLRWTEGNRVTESDSIEPTEG